MIKKIDLSCEVKMNDSLDKYYDLIEVYKRLDEYDQEMIWSIIQTVGRLEEKRKREEKYDKRCNL